MVLEQLLRDEHEDGLMEGDAKGRAEGIIEGHKKGYLDAAISH